MSDRPWSDAAWPNGPSEIVEEVQVAYSEREGRPVAILRLVDALGNHRDVEVAERASWAALVGFTHFLRQTHRGAPCTGCGRPPYEHPTDVCAHWH